jgi:hypothetical protein
MHDRPAVTLHQQILAQAVAQAVVALLKPILTEMNQKLDRIAETVEALLARLAAMEARIDEAARNGAMPPGEAG